MKQYRITSQNLVPEASVPDAVLDDADLRNLQQLAGIAPRNQPLPENIANISHTAMEKVNLMKQHNIKPGTPEWFQLWFSLPYLTSEKPVKD
jgi:hypothetical protein